MSLDLWEVLAGVGCFRRLGCYHIVLHLCSFLQSITGSFPGVQLRGSAGTHPLLFLMRNHRIYVYTKLAVFLPASFLLRLFSSPEGVRFTMVFIYSQCWGKKTKKNKNTADILCSPPLLTQPEMGNERKN